MAITVLRQPKYNFGPAGQDWLYSVTSSNVTQPKFKFIFDIRFHISTVPGPLDVRLRVSPGAVNIGNVNIREILEQHVSVDNHTHLQSPFPTFKGNSPSGLMLNIFSIHFIDKFATNFASLIHFNVRVGEEYASSLTTPSAVYPDLKIFTDNSVFNGVVPNGGQSVDRTLGHFGAHVNDANSFNQSIYGGPYVATNTGTSKFLTNGPTTQYIRDGDYGTFGILAGFINGVAAKWDRVKFTFSNGTSVDRVASNANGGRDCSSDTDIVHARFMLQYIGIGPANNSIYSSWINAYNASTSYTVALYDNTTRTSREYTFIKQTDDCKGYETIRLCWLNRHGAWDYYNFTKKSFREVDIERDTTTRDDVQYQIGLTRFNWNRNNRVYQTRAKESITCNSDWVVDDEAIWLEELFTSPEVYIVGKENPFDAGNNMDEQEFGYLTPVILSSTKYERYTKANDKVAQYEVELEVDSTVNVQKNQNFNLSF